MINLHLKDILEKISKNFSKKSIDKLNFLWYYINVKKINERELKNYDNQKFNVKNNHNNKGKWRNIKV